MLQQTAHLLVVILGANRIFFSQNSHVKHFLFWLVSIVGKLNSLCGKETSENHIVVQMSGANTWRVVCWKKWSLSYLH